MTCYSCTISYCSCPCSSAVIIIRRFISVVSQASSFDPYTSGIINTTSHVPGQGVFCWRRNISSALEFVELHGPRQDCQTPYTLQSSSVTSHPIRMDCLVGLHVSAPSSYGSCCLLTAICSVTQYALVITRQWFVCVCVCVCV